MNESQLENIVKQILYSAFKRGIGWKLSNPESTEFNLASTKYANDELKETVKLIIQQCSEKE